MLVWVVSRESLESIIIEMAVRVVKLINSNLKYYNDEAIECVISDSTIGRIIEAQRCE